MAVRGNRIGWAKRRRGVTGEESDCYNIQNQGSTEEQDKRSIVITEDMRQEDSGRLKQAKMWFSTLQLHRLQ